MKSLTIGCLGVLIGIVIGALGVFAAGALLAPQLVPVNAAVVPPTTSRPDMSVTVSDRYVDAQMRQAVIQTGLAQQATTTLLAPNQVRVATTVPIDLFGQPLVIDVSATMGLKVVNRRVVLSVDGITAEGINIPPSLVASPVEQVRANEEKTINQIVQQTLQGTRLHLINIRVLSDSVTLDLSSD